MSKPNFHYVDQRSEEWKQLRRGIPTASQFHKIFTPGGKPSGEYDRVAHTIKWSKQAKEYMYRLIAERLMNETFEDDVRGKWVEHGIECEPMALAKFAERRKLTLRRVGLVTIHDDTSRMIGCSPDALVEGSIDAVEVKCKSPWEHMRYLLEGPEAAPNDYKPQVQGQLYIGGFNKVHFYAFHPRMPSLHVETRRDEAYIRDLADVIDAFCYELERLTDAARMLGRYLSPEVEVMPGLDWMATP